MKRIASIMATTALVLGLFAGSPTAVSATSFAPSAEVDHWVSKGGRLVSDASGGYSCSRPGYRLISAAADAAEPGDVIHVCRGTYLEDDIELPSDPTSGITIQGDGPNRTFIDARGNGRIFISEFSAPGEGESHDIMLANLRIADMTLRNANADDSFISIVNFLGDEIGGAVFSAGRVVCNNVRFTSNNASGGGGAIASYYGADLERCSFVGNEGFAGGAIWSRGTVNDRGGIYTNNVATVGGAIYAGSTYSRIYSSYFGVDATVGLTNTFEDSIFTKNFGEAGGGAVMVEAACTRVTDVRFTQNQSLGAGGALYMNEYSFEGPWGGGPVGMDPESCRSLIEGTTFTSNSVSGVGGAVAYFGGLDDLSTGVAIEDPLDYSSGLTILNSSFRSNAAALGGAMYMDDGLVRLYGVNFYGNRARQAGVSGVGGYGSAIYASDFSVIDFGDDESWYADDKHRATFELNTNVMHHRGTYEWYFGPG
jgi:predicted outer membrane repeat protein